MREEKRKPSKKKIFSRIFSALLAALLLYVVGGMVICRMRSEVFFFGDKTAVYVMSGSMEPTIKAGSFVIVERVTPDEVAVGDVILFVSSDPAIKGQFNTHEVVNISADREIFYTKGINNAVKDAYPPKAADIRARYVGNADFLNRFFGWFLTKTGLILTLVFIVLLCSATYLPGALAALKENPEKAKAEKEAVIQKRIREEVARLQKEREELPPPTKK